MPAVSTQQQKLMCGVASGSIKGSGIPKNVAEEFCTKVKAKDSGKDDDDDPATKRAKQQASDHAMDRATIMGTHELVEPLALDRESLRAYDADNRLHVRETPISKANVCPYRGSEIPRWRELGLDGDRIYRMYRHPEELARAAATFNNLPLLSTHVPVTADDHRPDLVVGSTGSHAVIDGPYLKNSLVVWAKDSIGDIEANRKKQLSSAYRYRADMTPGITSDGQPYDGVMRDIIGNHVALVERGRAGPDVVVGDSAGEHDMKTLSGRAVLTQGALITYLAPLLAKDAEIDIRPIVEPITSDNFAAQIPAISAGLKAATAGKLAQDAKLDGLDGLLEQIGKIPVVEPAAPQPAPQAHDSGEYISRKDAQIAVDAAIQAATKDIPTQINAAVQAEAQRQTAIREAERFVHPWTGDLTVTMDSAEAVYRHALKTLGVKHEEIKDVGALKIVLDMQPKPGERRMSHSAAPVAAPAMDAAADKALDDFVPGLKTIKIL